MMRRQLITLYVAVGLLAACQLARPLLTEEDQVMARQLSGTWDLQFTLDRSPLITLDVAKAPRVINGKLSLLANTSLNRSFDRIRVPTNYGSYDIDRSPFGFDPRLDEGTPTVVAGRLSRDSVEIIFSPNRSSEQLVLRGRIRNSVVQGIWHVSLPATGGQGSFRLQRTPSAN